MNPAVSARALAADLCKALKKNNATISWKLDGDKAILTAVIESKQAETIVTEAQKQN